MAHGIPIDMQARLADIGRRSGASLLALFGSRARGEARPTSDWDLAYVAGDAFDPDALLVELVSALGSDRIDLVDLDRVGAVLRYRAARDGVLLYESEPRRFERFQLAAISFWCEVESGLRRAYEGVLCEYAR